MSVARSFAVAFMLVPTSLADPTVACTCNSSWSYPTDYEKSACVGPFHGCPIAPCDGDTKGPWCVVTDPKCKQANEYKDDGRKYYYAYCAPSSSGPTLSPDALAIRYMGRFDFANPKVPRFSWSMTGFSVAFHGSRIVFGSFTFPKGGGRLRIIVDGTPQGFIEQSGYSSMKLFKLADNLDAEKPHTLQVFKVTEDGVMTFGGVQLDAGQFDSTPKAPSRRLEFIGDSDTAGWCADGSSQTGDTESKFENAYVTWAQQLARSLGAEPMVEAVSGWGVTKSSHPIQDVLDYSIRFGSKMNWDYTKWTPDGVVILIGPNDESQKLLQPAGTSFVKSYKRLLDMVASNYKNASRPPKIVHVCGGSGNGLDPCDDIQTANDQFNKEQSGSGIKGYYTTITKEHWNLINGPQGKGTSQYNGCDSHYSEKGHQVLAQDILPQLQKIMGWEDLLDSLIV